MHFFCKCGASEVFAKLFEFVKETQYRYLENVHKLVGRMDFPVGTRTIYARANPKPREVREQSIRLFLT